MNSFEWRLKKLEDRICGPSHLDRSQDQKPLFDQLNSIATHYKNFIDNEDKNYTRFVELYGIHKDLLSKPDNASDMDCDTSKAELVLAYEADLKRFFNDTKLMAEKADKVLNIENWPDLSGYQDRLANLQTITKEQHLKSTVLDKKTEESIEIYNDIIGAFKRNMLIWEQKLEEKETQAAEGANLRAKRPDDLAR